MVMSDVTIEKLRTLAEEYVLSEPVRIGVDGFWRTPLLVSAPVDRRFESLPQIAFVEHMHPNDLLATARSVIVFFIPFQRELIKENKKGDRPCRNWGLAYVQTNDLIAKLGLALAGLLEEEGHQTGLTPATHNFDEVKLMANFGLLKIANGPNFRDPVGNNTVHVVGLRGQIYW